MDPITATLGIAGLATSLYGGIMGAGVARQEAQVSQDVAKQEGQENNLNQQLMNIQSRRAQLQTMRNTQKARAYGIQAGATQTGSLTGSGVQGGQASSADQGIFGLTGINQTTGINNDLFSINNNITADKMQLASLGGQAATDQGIQSIGGAIMNVSSIAGKFGSGMFSFGGGTATGGKGG
jgi:hypothetical protein